jgi:hypothetical protein
MRTDSARQTHWGAFCRVLLNESAGDEIVNREIAGILLMAPSYDADHNVVEPVMRGLRRVAPNRMIAIAGLVSAWPHRGALARSTQFATALRDVADHGPGWLEVFNHLVRGVSAGAANNPLTLSTAWATTIRQRLGNKYDALNNASQIQGVGLASSGSYVNYMTGVIPSSSYGDEARPAGTYGNAQAAEDGLAPVGAGGQNGQGGTQGQGGGGAGAVPTPVADEGVDPDDTWNTSVGGEPVAGSGRGGGGVVQRTPAPVPRSAGSGAANPDEIADDAGLIAVIAELARALGITCVQFYKIWTLAMKIRRYLKRTSGAAFTAAETAEDDKFDSALRATARLESRGSFPVTINAYP